MASEGALSCGVGYTPGAASVPTRSRARQGRQLKPMKELSRQKIESDSKSSLANKIQVS
jgi:hypothetical protein